MDLDSVYIEPLIYDWLEHLQETVQEQQATVNDETDFFMAFVAIPPATIKAFFKMADYLEIAPVNKYMAIHLYDKFMCNYFWESYKAETANGPSEDSWNQICKKISSQSKLYLLSCLQLAYKMDSHSSNFGIAQIINILYILDKKLEYTSNTISSSEFKVFKTVGFKMPLCTPLHCIEIFLAITGLRETPGIYDLSINLLDLTYLQHDKIYTRLQHVMQKHNANTELAEKNLISLKSNVLFVSAAVVLCTTFFLCLNTGTVESKIIAEKLAELTDIKDTDLWNMANILLLMAIDE